MQEWAIENGPDCCATPLTYIVHVSVLTCNMYTQVTILHCIVFLSCSASLNDTQSRDRKPSASYRLVAIVFWINQGPPRTLYCVCLSSCAHRPPCSQSDESVYLNRPSPMQPCGWWTPSWQTDAGLGNTKAGAEVSGMSQTGVKAGRKQSSLSLSHQQRVYQ